MDKVYICPTCQQPFQRKQQFRRHSNSHKGSPLTQSSRPLPKMTRSTFTSKGKRTMPPLQTSSTPNHSDKLSHGVQSMRETCITNPFGLPLDGPNTSTAEGMDEWLECFWPGYIGTLLKPSFHVEERGLGDDARSGTSGRDKQDTGSREQKNYGPSSSSAEDNSHSTMPSVSLSPVGA